MASRLSYGLWDSMPDRELLHAAAAGKLATRDEVTRQAERMLDDPRAKAKLRTFLLSWTDADRPRKLSKDSKKFPGFNSAVIADLRTSLEMFLDHVAWSKKSDFRQLLLANTVYLNGRLAKFYGAKLPPDAPFTKVALDDGLRAGVLTHPYLMSSFAHSKDTSPVLRGVFLRARCAGGFIASAAGGIRAAIGRIAAHTDHAERVILQTKSDNCMMCHGIINPLGFTLEHFDAVGRYREKDNGKAVDASGEYKTRDGATVSVQDARGTGEISGR